MTGNQLHTSRPYYKMIRHFTFFTPLLLLGMLCSGQPIDSVWTKEISIPGDRHIKKTHIPLFETDSFIVYSTYRQLVKNIRQFIHEHDVGNDKLLLNELLANKNSLSKKLAAIQANDLLQSRLMFRTGDLQQEKKCLVYNKITRNLESKLVVTEYIKNWFTGIAFFTPAGEKIMDLVTGVF